MGCDIHIQIERRRDGKWQRVPWVNDWRQQHARFYADARAESPVSMPEDFDRRNYDLFGVLANVRNGTWGAENPPIAEPRGLPSDADIPPDGDDGCLGDHSFSWVTLRELQAYPWDALTRKRGWVSHETAAKFKVDGVPPTSYSASGNHGEYITWTETIRHDVRDWPEEVLPILATLGEPDDVRLVFGFDS